jgi:hypothetical protein
MATSGSGTGTPIAVTAPTSTPVNAACLCFHCQPDSAYTSLEAWRESMCCLEPWQFWGFDHADLRKAAQRPCKDIVYEQAGRTMVGRQNIRQAQLNAENEFLSQLGYSPVLRWFNEQLEPDRMVRTRQKYITALGTPIRTVFATAERDAQVVAFSAYTADPGDTLVFSAKQATAKWPDTFTLTLAIPVGLTDPAEVCVYIHPDDRYEKRSDDARWKIEPVEVTISGGVLTITGRSWLLAKPELYDVYGVHPAPVSAFNDYSIDPSWMPNYVERLQVARCTVDQCNAGLIRTRPDCECGGCLCEFNDEGTPTHCHTCTEIDLCVENARFGLIRPLYPHNSAWSTNPALCLNEPRSVCVHYQAGDCSRDWTRDLSILATTYLCGICSCDFPCLSRWWEDIALNKENTSKQNTFELLNNPFGTLAGHIETWKTIERHKWRSVGTW